MTEQFESQRLIFRPWKDSDYDEFHEICSDAAVMQFVGDGHVWNGAEVEAFITREAQHLEDHGYCRWALSLKSDPSSLLGFCGFVPAEEGAEIGWRLKREAWGLGLGTEAARAAINHGFNHLGFETIIATIQEQNDASIRVAQKLGMVHTGTIARQYGELLRFSICASIGKSS